MGPCIEWFFSDPTENSCIQSLQESDKRLNGKPVNKKDHVTSQMIIKLCSQFKDSDDLMIIRDLAMIALSFAGFLRFDYDVTVHDNFLNLKIVHSKTDQYRQGNEVIISKGNKYLGLSSFYS